MQPVWLRETMIGKGTETSELLEKNLRLAFMTGYLDGWMDCDLLEDVDPIESREIAVNQYIEELLQGLADSDN